MTANATNTRPIEKDQPSNSPTVAYDQGWLASWMRPTLLALMVACLNLTLLTFLRRFIPSLGIGFTFSVAFLGIVAAVIASVSTAWLAQPNQRLRRSLAYRGAEIVLILVTTRVAVWITTGTWPTLREIITQPLSTLFDGIFLLAFAIVTVSWVIAGEMSRDLLDMALQPDELYLTQPNHEHRGDGMRARTIDRRVLMTSFVIRWVIGGVLLILLAAGATVDFGNFGLVGLARLQIPGVVVFAIIFYFLAGMLLISQGQLAILRARWALDHAPSQEAVTRHWPVYVGSMLLVIGALAALMPLGGTYWLSRIVGGIIGGLYMVFFFVFQLLTAALILLLALLPFGSEENAAPPASAQPVMPDITATPPPEFLEWASGAVFWLAAAALLGYLAMIYFTDKGIRPGWLTWLWALLHERWQQWTGTWRTWQQTRVHGASDDDAGGHGKGGRRGWSWPWQRSNSPEATVRALYFAVLHAAQEAGVPRRQGETPHHFAPRLSSHLEDEAADEAVHALTDAFAGVRYGHQSVHPEEASRLEELWATLRSRVRRQSSR